MPNQPQTRLTIRRFWPFVIWLGAFYAVWISLILTGDLWSRVTDHWPIAVAMAGGSYIAGSTPMGGGTIGFPILVLLFDFPASLGRNFGLAVQSIGMVSASIYIFSARRPLDWHLLRPALAGSLIGTPLGVAFVAPFAPDLGVKLLFAVLWASFGLMHLVKLRSLTSATGLAGAWPGLDRPAGLLIGLIGGIVASLTGVGIDMMIYAALVLIYRADLKIAIPTSVVLMAFTSVLGIGANLVLSQLIPEIYRISPEVFYNWLAAAPIVALGAPFGAFVVNRLPRTPTLVIVSVLCIGQFIWTLAKEDVSGLALAVAIGGVLITNLVFHLLYGWSANRQRAEPFTSARPSAAAPLAKAALGGAPEHPRPGLTAARPVASSRTH